MMQSKWVRDNIIVYSRDCKRLTSIVDTNKCLSDLSMIKKNKFCYVCKYL